MAQAPLSPRPLSGSDRDRALLVGRGDAVAQVVRAVDFGINTLVLAARGAGKTSLLRIFEAQWQSDGRPTVWIAGAYIESAVDVVDAVAFELDVAREAYRSGVAETMVSALTTFSGRREVMGAPNEVLIAIRWLRSQLAKRPGEEGQRAIIIVDDLRPEVAHSLFGRARDELWSLPLLWVVAGDKARSADYLKPPADSFFGKVMELPELSETDALAVLRLRVDDRLPAEIAARIVDQAKGNPRRLIALATEALLGEDQDPAGVLDRDRVVMDRLQELGPSAERLWAAIVPLGPVSAHDPFLLDQLGWSRVRASQVLNQLEKAGLVESSTEKASHGRPRKVYRVRSGTAGA